MFNELFESSLSISGSDKVTQEKSISVRLPSCKGVLLFVDSAGRPIQLLTAANIRRTVRSRLFPIEGDSVSKRTKISGISAKVYWRCCFNDFKTNLTYCRIARRVYPETYKELLPYRRGVYVSIDLSSKWPGFSLTQKVRFCKDERIFGPFPSRRSAGDFIKAINIAFELCQKPDIIDSEEKARSCPYLQMGSCPAPCVGKIDKTQYLEQIEDAVGAAGGDAEKYILGLEVEMNELSEKLDFEKAAKVKNRIEQLKLLTWKDYRWTMELGRLAVLHIDKSSKIAGTDKRRKIQTYSAFLIKGGVVVELGDFRVEEIDKLYELFLSELEKPAVEMDSKMFCEQLALLAYFLYRDKARGVWINCSDRSSCFEIPTVDHVREAVFRMIEV